MQENIRAEPPLGHCSMPGGDMSRSPFRYHAQPAVVGFFSIAVTLVALFGVLATTGCTARAGGEAEDDSSKTVQNADENSTANETGKTGRNEGEQKDGQEQSDEDTATKEEAVPIEVITLKTGKIESVIRSSANLEAEASVQVFSQATGIVQELKAEEGDRVRAGQLLVRLQDADQRNEVALRQALQKKAEREFRRQKKLWEDQLISEQAFIDARYALEQADIQLEQAKQALSYTEVRAPISGTVTSRMVNLGERVTASQQLFEMVDFASIVARIYVPEKNLQELSVGLRARVIVPALENRSYEGKVLRIAPTVDARSGTIKVTVALGGQPGLRPGLYVDVDLVTAQHHDTILIPKRALVYDKDQTFVFRLGDERRVERLLVTPRLEDKHFIEPASGLSVGDRIVVAGQSGLKDGALVSLPGDDADDDDEDRDDDSVAHGTEAEKRASL